MASIFSTVKMYNTAFFKLILEKRHRNKTVLRYLLQNHSFHIKLKSKIICDKKEKYSIKWDTLYAIHAMR